MSLKVSFSRNLGIVKPNYEGLQSEGFYLLLGYKSQKSDIWQEQFFLKGLQKLKDRKGYRIQQLYETGIHKK